MHKKSFAVRVVPYSVIVEKKFKEEVLRLTFSSYEIESMYSR